jgi:DNA repair protein SbcD/Mre11
LFKFIHTADVHLDSPLIGLSQFPGAPMDLLREATRLSFSKLIDMALEEGVAFMIIAGDLYDGTWKDINTGLFFVSEMNRLRNKGIRCYLLYGNHDAESQLTKTLPLPDNVFIFKTRNAHTYNLEDVQVSVHGQSFKERDTTNNLAADYPEPVSGVFNIGVLHTGLEGYAAHAHYAPCTLDQLKAKGYNYWALGHIHQGEILNENPHIIFPGNLQGRKITEHGRKGAVLVTVEETTIIDVQWIYPDIVRWSQLNIDLTSCNLREEALAISETMMHKAVEQEAEGRTLAMRIIFNIRSELYSSIVFDEAYFRAELQSIATGNYGDALWVEKIKFKVLSETESTNSQDHRDAVYELKNMLNEAANDQILIKTIVQNMEALLRLLPPDIRSNADLELLSHLQAKKPKEVVEEVIPFLLSALLQQEES